VQKGAGPSLVKLERSCDIQEVLFDRENQYMKIFLNFVILLLCCGALLCFVAFGAVVMEWYTIIPQWLVQMAKSSDEGYLFAMFITLVPAMFCLVPTTSLYGLLAQATDS